MAAKHFLRFIASPFGDIQGFFINLNNDIPMNHIFELALSSSRLTFTTGFPKKNKRVQKLKCKTTQKKRTNEYRGS